MQNQHKSRSKNKLPHQQPVPLELRPDVQAAVDDIMSGNTADSASEWLQREFQRLMHREAEYRRANPSQTSEAQGT